MNIRPSALTRCQLEIYTSHVYQVVRLIPPARRPYWPYTSKWSSRTASVTWPCHGNSVRSHSWPDTGMSGILQSTEWSQPCLVDTLCAQSPGPSPWSPHSISTTLNMEMQPNTVAWKGLTDTQCPVCDWLLKCNMVHHIHQNHTECVTSGDAHLESPGLYEYNTVHNRSCTMATSFPTHKFTYILPGIPYHQNIQSIMRGMVLTRWHVPCTEPRMITAILANLWRFDCQIIKNLYFCLRF